MKRNRRIRGVRRKGALVLASVAAIALPVALQGQDGDSAERSGPWVFHEVTSVAGGEGRAQAGLLPGRRSLRTASGSEYEVSPPLAPQAGPFPRLIVLRNGGIFRILVEGGGPELQGRQINPPRTRPGTDGEHADRDAVVAGRIDGEFLGFDGNTVVRLTNGQDWQQTDQTRTAVPLQNPAVVVVRDGASYLMRVTGIPEWVRVRRLD